MWKKIVFHEIHAIIGTVADLFLINNNIKYLHEHIFGEICMTMEYLSHSQSYEMHPFPCELIPFVCKHHHKYTKNLQYMAECAPEFKVEIKFFFYHKMLAI